MVSVAASRYFSAQVTADGRVWTYGGGFNGELGGAGSSWLSAARPVDGPIAEVQPTDHLPSEQPLLAQPKDATHLHRRLTIAGVSC